MLIIRKLHEIYLLEKVSSSGLAFYIEIGTHRKYHKLPRSINLLEPTPFVLQNTARVHFEVVHRYSFHRKTQQKKKNKPWNAISINSFALQICLNGTTTLVNTGISFISILLKLMHHQRNTNMALPVFHKCSQTLPWLKPKATLNWLVAAVTVSSYWVFLYPKRLHCLLQQGRCRQYGSSDCFWFTTYHIKINHN